MLTDYTNPGDGVNPYQQSSLNTGLLSNSSTSLAFVSTLESSDLLDAPIPAASSFPHSSSLRADFNGDGHEDLLWRNSVSGQVVLWLMNGTTLSSAVTLANETSLNWRIQGVGDFTGDNRADILWRNYTTGDNAIWVMDGTRLVSVEFLSPLRDTNWQAQGVADFTRDGRIDILWRNYATGQNAVWTMNGTALVSSVFLPDVPGVNLRVEAIGDLTQDGNVDILWRNYLSGENLVWLMNGLAVSSTHYLMPVSDLNWEIRGIGDFNRNGRVDILWQNSISGLVGAWLMNGLEFDRVDLLPNQLSANWQITFQETRSPVSPVTVNNLSFSGWEGDRGQFQLRLTQAPSSPVRLTFSTGAFVVVDADGDIRNGTQNSITFTPDDWFVPRTVSFIAEVDGSSQNRLMGNTVAYTLAGGLNGSAAYDLGVAFNTYAPDPTRFNIDLDFRNDYLGFWTPARQAIARQAADDWAVAIANEWADFQLNSTLRRLETSQGRPYSFTSKRYVDDLLVFVNLYQDASGTEPALGGPDYEFGGWISSPASYGVMPRVGQIAISPTVFANQPDSVLYQVVSHEIGHVLGLLGLNWTGYLKQDRSNPATATFRGDYSRQVYGEYIPLQSQDGGDFYHPAARVPSIMSYGYIYTLPGPNQLDYAMLADSGYRIYGINV